MMTNENLCFVITLARYIHFAQFDSLPWLRDFVLPPLCILSIGITFVRFRFVGIVFVQFHFVGVAFVRFHF
jgi:hypothetical protein